MKSNADPEWFPRFYLMTPPADLFSTVVIHQREKITSM